MKYRYESKLIVLDPASMLTTFLNRMSEMGQEIFAIIPIRHVSALVVYREAVVEAVAAPTKGKKS